MISPEWPTHVFTETWGRHWQTGIVICAISLSIGLWSRDCKHGLCKTFYWPPPPPPHTHTFHTHTGTQRSFPLRIWPNVHDHSSRRISKGSFMYFKNCPFPHFSVFSCLVEDYWVISTDYVNYALVYSCGQVQDDGTCDPALTHAWIMSRSGQPLDKGSNKVVAYKMLNELCLHIDRITEIPTGTFTLSTAYQAKTTRL